MKHRKRGCVVRNIKAFASLFTDYAEELRFYLIHMTEVRERLVFVCV